MWMLRHQKPMADSDHELCELAESSQREMNGLFIYIESTGMSRLIFSSLGCDRKSFEKLSPTKIRTLMTPKAHFQV
jgi:hypothetical protein